MKSIQQADVQFRASDGFLLTGSFFKPVDTSRGGILLAGATGIRRGFYGHFAQWLAGEGYHVVSFDYRGVGDSLPGHPKHCTARKQDWGQLDMPSALDFLHQRTGGQPLYLIGHSAGGQLVGLMPNWQKLQGMIGVACSSGYVGGMAWPMRWNVHFLMGVVVPLSVQVLGYVPAARLGWGADLPAGVAQQWVRWCSHPGYIANGFGREISHHWYGKLDMPALWLYAEDDPIVTPTNVEDFLRICPAFNPQRKSLRPADYGLACIGHMGLFRREGASLWPILAEWLAKKNSVTKAWEIN